MQITPQYHITIYILSITYLTLPHIPVKMHFFQLTRLWVVDLKFYCIAAVSTAMKKAATLAIAHLLPAGHTAMQLVFKKSTTIPRCPSLN
jgi:hypothetical protein